MSLCDRAKPWLALTGLFVSENGQLETRYPRSRSRKFVRVVDISEPGNDFSPSTE
jgi:hypothetical protein